MSQNDTTAIALRNAALAIALAAQKARTGDHLSIPFELMRVGGIAIEAVTADEDWLAELADPQSRRARCAYSGWLILQAAASDGGQAEDLFNNVASSLPACGASRDGHHR